MLKELLKKARSYRRYDQSYTLDEGILRELVDCARISSSTSNRQPLRYKLVYTQPLLEQVFAFTKWGGAFKDYNGPEPGERPTGYIVIVSEKAAALNTSATDRDLGIAAEVIALCAVDKGLGTCMINSFSRPACRELLGLGEEYEPELVVAVGKPTEQILLEETELGESLTYYRTGMVHHVPKRKLNDILL